LTQNKDKLSTFTSHRNNLFEIAVSKIVALLSFLVYMSLPPLLQFLSAIIYSSSLASGFKRGSTLGEQSIGAGGGSERFYQEWLDKQYWIVPLNFIASDCVLFLFRACLEDRFSCQNPHKIQGWKVFHPTQGKPYSEQLTTTMSMQKSFLLFSSVLHHRYNAGHPEIRTRLSLVRCWKLSGKDSRPTQLKI
jgi:hypothetical protein